MQREKVEKGKKEERAFQSLILLGAERTLPAWIFLSENIINMYSEEEAEV